MNNQTNKETEQLRDGFLNFLASEADSVQLIFHAHSFYESILDRLITLFLPKGNQVIRHAHLTFEQKLVLADAFDIVEDRYIRCLNALNTVSNKYARQSVKELSHDDIIVLSQALDKMSLQSKQSEHYNDKLLFRGVLGDLCVHLCSKVLDLENRDHSELLGNKP
jgi:hypothetical protein